MTMKLRTILLFAGAIMSAASAGAAVINTLPGGLKVAMPVANEVTQGPRQFGPITYSMDFNDGVYGWTQPYSFQSNGSWSGVPMAGVNAGFGAMRFTFAFPVSAVLAEMNWRPTGTNQAPAVMTAFDINGQFLETRVFSLASDNVVAPGYWGFGYGSDIIKSIALSNGYIGARRLSIAYTGMPVSGVPEPASWGLMLAGFGLVGVTIRRRQRQATITA